MKQVTSLSFHGHLCIDPACAAIYVSILPALRSPSCGTVVCHWSQDTVYHPSQCFAVTNVQHRINQVCLLQIVRTSVLGIKKNQAHGSGESLVLRLTIHAGCTQDTSHLDFHIRHKVTLRELDSIGESFKDLPISKSGCPFMTHIQHVPGNIWCSYACCNAIMPASWALPWRWWGLLRLTHGCALQAFNYHMLPRCYDTIYLLCQRISWGALSF